MTERRFGAHAAFEAIGTHWVVEFDPPEDHSTDALLKRVRSRIDQFDKNYSRFRDDSLVSRMARQAGSYTLPADAAPMFDLYRHLYEVSDGAVTPLIGQPLSDAGYDASYSLTPKAMVQPPAWNETLDYNYPLLTLKQPALLDVGALGKGYLVDLVAELLDELGCAAYCVNAGGDMRCRGRVEVALEHPRDDTQAVGTVTLQNRSLCGSAGNRRAWAGFHHILDPRTLQSPQHLLAVWTVAETTLLADAMSTALFFTSHEQLREIWDFEYAIVARDGSLTRSSGFPGEFFV